MQEFFKSRPVKLLDAILAKALKSSLTHFLIRMYVCRTFFLLSNFPVFLILTRVKEFVESEGNTGKVVLTDILVQFGKRRNSTS